jgi:hypothetical protein
MESDLFKTLLLGFCCLVSQGCRHIGPSTIRDDRIPYNEAIADSWKQQTLLNLVRLRYGDLPEFIDVSSVVTGFERGRTANGAIGMDMFPNASLDNGLSLGAGGTQTFIDRPTISYLPQANSEFVRHLVEPLMPIAILNLIESGAPADIVLELTVESINGIRNRGFTGEFQEGDPEFQEVVRIFKKAQDSGQTSLRITQGSDSKNPDVLFGIRDSEISSELNEELDYMRRLLRLDPDQKDFKIVFGMLPQKNNEIAFRTRNIIRIMNYLSLNVEVPLCHLEDGRAEDYGVVNTDQGPSFMVHSGCEPPSDCFTCVQYQGHWFWIDHRDAFSKRAMSHLKVLLALVDTKQKEGAPVLTIRAN